MKAVRYYGPHDIRVEHIAEPAAMDGQVKIKVRYVLPRPCPSLLPDEHRLLGTFV